MLTEAGSTLVMEAYDDGVSGLREKHRFEAIGRL